MIENRKNGIPLLSYDEDKKLMLHLMHNEGLISMNALHKKGIRARTLRRHWRRERAVYMWPAVPLAKKPQCVKKKNCVRKLKNDMTGFYAKKKQRDEANLRSWKKLDDAIRQRSEAKQSVIDYYLHRNETSQDEPGQETTTLRTEDNSHSGR